MRPPAALWLLLAACGESSAPLDEQTRADGGALEHDGGAHDAGGAHDSSAHDGGAAAEDAAAEPDAARYLIMPALEDGGQPDACNQVLNDGPLIEAQYVPADMPAPRGGTLAEGVYERAAVRHYTGAGGDAGAVGATDRTVAWFTQGKFHFSQTTDTIENQHLSGTYTLDGTRLTLTRTCPAPETTSAYDRFDASETEIVFYSSTQQRALVYRRR